MTEAGDQGTAATINIGLALFIINIDTFSSDSPSKFAFVISRNVVSKIRQVSQLLLLYLKYNFL
jgi:hypothetical protein